jgi:hypothetical protein
MKKYSEGNFKILRSYEGYGLEINTHSNTYVRISKGNITWTVLGIVFIQATIVWEEFPERISCRSPM